MARPLSALERQIMRMVADGKRDKEIAKVVNMHHNSVRQCVTRVLVKLGAHTRAQAAVLLVKDEI